MSTIQIANHMKKVLYVDDNKKMLDLIDDFFKSKSGNVNIITESNPEKGLKICKEKDIECVISDYEMPEMNGLKFLEQVKKINDELPVILYTGSKDDKIAREAFSIGIDELMYKNEENSRTHLFEATKEHLEKYNNLKNLKKYEDVINAIIDIITIVDEKGVIKYETPSISMLGYEQEELYGKNVFEKLIHPDDRSRVFEKFSEVVNNESETLPSVEYRLQKSDGNYVWAESRSHPNNSISLGSSEGFVINTRLIPQRKKQEKEIKGKNHRLQQFADVIGHDIPNHLQVINGYAEMLKGHDPEKVEKILNSSKRIKELLDNMDKVVEDKEIDKSWHSIKEILDDLSIDKQKAKIHLENEFKIKADKEKLLQIIENLIWNSIEHNDKELIEIKIGSTSNSFYVEDNGDGIPEGELENIFGMGYSTGKDHEGLGLTMVETISIEHGWDVSASNTESGGARFNFDGCEISQK